LALIEVVICHECQFVVDLLIQPIRNAAVRKCQFEKGLFTAVLAIKSLVLPKKSTKNFPFIFKILSLPLPP